MTMYLDGPHACLTTCPPVDVEVVPHNEGLNRPQVQPLEGVVHHEAVLARVLVDLVEVLLQQSLLLQTWNGWGDVEIQRRASRQTFWQLSRTSTKFCEIHREAGGRHPPQFHAKSWHSLTGVSSGGHC